MSVARMTEQQLQAHQVAIKPLSVNAAWKGRRFKTDDYKRYERAMLLLLPKRVDVPAGELSVSYEFGLSNRSGDWDNPVKPFQDLLQKKYGFNDSRIMRATVKKVIVKKGSEYVKFSIRGMDEQ